MNVLCDECKGTLCRPDGRKCGCAELVTLQSHEREVARLRRQRDEAEAAYVRVILRGATPEQRAAWADGDPIDAMGMVRSPGRLGRLVMRAATVAAAWADGNPIDAMGMVRSPGRLGRAATVAAVPAIPTDEDDEAMVEDLMAPQRTGKGAANTAVTRLAGQLAEAQHAYRESEAQRGLCLLEIERLRRVLGPGDACNGDPPCPDLRVEPGSMPLDRRDWCRACLATHRAATPRGERRPMSESKDVAGRVGMARVGMALIALGVALIALGVIETFWPDLSSCSCRRASRVSMAWAFAGAGFGLVLFASRAATPEGGAPELNSTHEAYMDRVRATDKGAATDG